MQNKYTTITISNKHPLKLRQLSRDFRSFYYWLQRNGYNWTAINVYDRKSGDFLIQLTPANYWSKIQNL